MIIRTALALSLGLMLVPAGQASAQTIPSGSYTQSCTNERINGNQLIARCTAANGTHVRTTLDLNACRNGDIANNNGQLVCNRSYNGNYNNGNYNNGNYNNGNGNANHRRDNDDRDRDRDNNGNNGNNGNHYGRGNGNGYGNGNGNGYTIPTGSYQSSCQNVGMRGGLLVATCTSANGSQVTTTLDPSRCNGSDIANQNGRLTCTYNR